MLASDLRDRIAECVKKSQKVYDDSKLIVTIVRVMRDTIVELNADSSLINTYFKQVQEADSSINHLNSRIKTFGVLANQLPGIENSSDLAAGILATLNVLCSLAIVKSCNIALHHDDALRALQSATSLMSKIHAASGGTPGA
jgi:hypothetical protein